MRVDHAVTSGTFSLDGETFDVDNNVWVIGDDEECIVLMPRIRSRTSSTSSTAAKVKAIVCTHAHDDHVRYAPELAQATGAPIWLHP